MQRQIQQKRYHIFNRLNGLFFFVVCLSSIGFSIIHPVISLMIHRSKIDIIDESLPDIARRLRWVYPQGAQAIDAVQTLISRYNNKEDIRSGNIIPSVRSGLIYISHAQPYSGFVQDLAPHQEEISLLIGKNKPKHYIILLQNTAEKRPNGGFFGSFAFVTIDK